VALNETDKGHVRIDEVESKGERVEKVWGDECTLTLNLNTRERDTEKAKKMQRGDSARTQIIINFKWAESVAVCRATYRAPS
jgi:hypothetical protein